jgi:hypothetical protein
MGSTAEEVKVHAELWHQDGMENASVNLVVWLKSYFHIPQCVKIPVQNFSKFQLFYFIALTHSNYLNVPDAYYNMCGFPCLCGLVVKSSWLQILRQGFDSRHYQIFWEVVGLERGPLSLVSTTEQLLGRKVVALGLENGEYGSRDPLRWPRGILYPQNLALISPTSGGRSVGIVRSRTQVTEFLVFCAK